MATKTNHSHRGAIDCMAKTFSGVEQHPQGLA